MGRAEEEKGGEEFEDEDEDFLWGEVVDNRFALGIFRSIVGIVSSGRLCVDVLGFVGDRASSGISGFARLGLISPSSGIVALVSCAMDG